MTTVTITMRVNAHHHDAHHLIDEWVGLTAPAEVDSVNIECAPEEGEMDLNPLSRVRPGSRLAHLWGRLTGEDQR